MRMSKTALPTLGLVFITFLAAIQYVFLSNVPESVSTFTFVCITNLIGMIVLAVFQPRHLRAIRKGTLRKGAFFALLLTGFNSFILLGSRNMDSVDISSVVSLYFVFITPILLLLRKKVHFFSGIATVMAIIALVLLFGGGNGDVSFLSQNVGYLVIADIFFATYVVGVSLLGSNEDSSALTFTQLAFSVVFSLIVWGLEAFAGKTTFTLPMDRAFWISAVFIGVFIRAVYGIIQISCQKHVSAIRASLIFASEIIITILMAPWMSRIMGTPYTPATVYQIIGAVILIVATLIVDETVMGKLGYTDMTEPSVSKKMVVTTITFSMAALIFATVIGFSAIFSIRNAAVDGSTQLGMEASEISTAAMKAELERSTERQAQDKAVLAEQKLSLYQKATGYAASYASSLFARAEEYPEREVGFAREENAGKWTIQLLLANEDVDYESLKAESKLLGNMEDVFTPIAGGLYDILTIYMGTEDGLMISYDKFSQLAAGEENQYFEYRGSSWYNLGKEKGTPVFTGAYWDSYGRGLTITCVAPFYGTDGSFLGCVAMDILISDLNAAMVNDGIEDPNAAIMINNDGSVIADRDSDPARQTTYSIFDPDRDGILKDIGHEILEKKDGIIRSGDGDDAVYVAFATIDSTDWTLCVMSPVSTVIAPALEIRSSIDSNTETVVSSVGNNVLTVLQNSLVLITIILLVVTLTAGYFSRKISDPLKKLTSDVQEISDGNLDQRTDVNTDDEIGRLANSFNQMTDSLQQYIADLKDVTAKEERIVGELTAAANIQTSMLPRNFDDFSCSEFDLYATMDPAKEVGGDFYDFFRVDDDHVALVMADVSGKGVPASLFMVVAKTLIKNHAQLGESPAEILRNVNEQLCEENEGGMFVTVWLAIIEISTGKGIAANAGHEHPTICRAGGRYELVEYRHSLAVAAMEGVRFREHPFELRPGDRLFVYTDGVPEATDAGDELFGSERMLAALNSDPGAAPKQLLRNVAGAIDAFVGDAPQFDDITMLGFHYIGSEKKTPSLTVEATVDNLARVLAFVDGELEAAGCPMKTQMQIDVAVEEIFVNIAHYAYAPGTGTATVQAEASAETKTLTVTFIDSGTPYDPLAKPDPDVTLSAEDRQIGGLGIYMVKKSMDNMRYEYRDGRNVLTLEKRF